MVEAVHLRCPECQSQKVWKDGLRYNKGRPLQRWICRNCGYRFSQNESRTPSRPLKKRSSWSINSGSAYSLPRQVCEFLTEDSKNLPKVETRQKQAAGATTKPTEADIKGYLTKFAAKQLLMGLEEKTVKGRFNVLRLLIKRGANLFNPESVFKAIDHAKRFNHKTKELLDEEWADGSKNNASQAYRVFCEIFNTQIPPHINFDKWTRQPQKLPWIPLERELDELTAGSSRKVATFLQLLKETGARSGEAWRLKWIDIDMEHGIVTYNLPEKGSNP